MSNEIKKGTMFVKEVLNRLVGDNNEALANNIGRKAISSLEGQIAALNGKLVDDQDVLEEATEALNNAIYPVSKITDGKAYCQNIVNKQQAVDAAEETIKNTQASIDYFQKILNKF